MGAPVPVPAPQHRALLDRARRARHLVAHRAGVPARHRRDHDRGRGRRRFGGSRPPGRRPARAVLHPGRRQLPPDVPARGGGGARGRPAPGRPVRAARDAVARLPRRTPRRRARVAAVERRDARAHDAHPDRHEPAVGGHRAGRLDHHPVHPQPDAAVHRAVAGARPDRRRDRVRPAAPAGQHAGPGHDRAEHDDRRGGAVGDPRRQELRPRGLGARALRRGPPDGRRDRLAAGAVAGDVRGADGAARLRGAGGAAVVHRPPGHRRPARDRHADRVPAVRRRDRCEPRHDRRAVRPVPGGDRGDHPGVRDHRHATDDPRCARRAAHGQGRRPDRARRRVVRVRARAAGPARRIAGHPGRGDPRPGRAVGLGQDHAHRRSSRGCGT